MCGRDVEREETMEQGKGENPEAGASEPSP